MVKYTFSLRSKSSNNTYEAAIDLEKNSEDLPERYFTQAVCDRIRIDLERQSSIRITDNQMRRIVTTWIEEIKEGYRNSEVTLDLRLINEANIEHLLESGNQEIPAVIYPDLSDVEPQRGALPPLPPFKKNKDEQIC